MEIQVYSPQQVPACLPLGIDKPVVFAIYEKPIRQWLIDDEPSLKTQLMAIFTKAYTKLGHSDEGSLMRTVIIDDLLTNSLVHNLSPKDIEIAIDRGLHGDYQTDFVTLNVFVVNRFLIAYKGQRMEVNKQLRALQEKEKQKEEEPVEVAIKSENTYKQLVKYMDDYQKLPTIWWPVLVFFHLEKIGEISQNNEQKVTYLHHVKLTLLSAAETARINQNKKEWQRISGIVSRKEDLADECRRLLATEWAEKYIQTISL